MLETFLGELCYKTPQKISQRMIEMFLGETTINKLRRKWHIFIFLKKSEFS